MEFVSIIIPTYNYGHFLVKCIDSVLNQTYSNIEIILVDDGSTDNTNEIIHTKYKNKVKYIYQENKGASVARNKGIDIARGEYLSFLDADDFFIPTSIEDRLNILQNNKEIGWVYSKWQYVDTEGNIIEKASQNASFAYNKRLRGNIFINMLSGTLINTSAVLIKRSCVEDAGGFDERLPAFQDYDFWLRVSHRHLVEYLDKVTVYMTVHRRSISSTQPPYPARAIINKKIEKNYGDYLDELGIRWRQIKAAEHNYLGGISLRKNQINSALEHFRASVIQYPFQKRVYLQILQAYLKKLKILSGL